MPTAATKIDTSLQKYLNEKCAQEECSPSEYLRNLIKYDQKKAQRGDEIRLRVVGDTLVVPCDRCGEPIPLKLAELGLRRI